MKHTKEPWEISAIGENGSVRSGVTDALNPEAWAYSIVGNDPVFVLGTIVGAVAVDHLGGRHFANAERIVACVNACDGINPEAVPDAIELIRSLGRLFYGPGDNEHGFNIPESLHKQLKTVLEKARAGQDQ